MTAEMRKPPKEVKIVHPSYQPSKAELEADMRADASFDRAVDALTRPVRIRYKDRPRRLIGAPVRHFPT